MFHTLKPGTPAGARLLTRASTAPSWRASPDACFHSPSWRVSPDACFHSLSFRQAPASGRVVLSLLLQKELPLRHLPVLFIHYPVDKYAFLLQLYFFQWIIHLKSGYIPAGDVADLHPGVFVAVAKGKIEGGVACRICEHF